MVTCGILLYIHVALWVKDVFCDVTGTPERLLIPNLILYLLMRCSFLLSKRAFFYSQNRTGEPREAAGRHSEDVRVFSFFKTFKHLIHLKSKRSPFHRFIFGLFSSVKTVITVVNLTAKDNAIQSSLKSLQWGNIIVLLCQYLGLPVPSVTWKVQAVMPGVQ